MRDQRVLVLAQQAVANAKSIAAAATSMGVSRPYLSRYLNDDLENNQHIEATIVKHCDRRECPHTHLVITPDVCARKALAPEPFGGLARHAQWVTCQTCPHKPAKAVP